MSLRMEKVDNMIKNEISVILNGIKDKYLGFITVTKVSTTKDLSVSRVYISSFEKIDNAQLNSVLKHYMRDIYTQFKSRIHLKKTPHLIFKIDNTPTDVEKLEDILSNIEYTVKEDKIEGQE